MPVSNRYIGTLPPGSGGSIVVTGTLTSTMLAGQTFVNTANITGTNVESSVSNNVSSVTGTIVSLPNITLDIQANNFTRPQLNTAPNGSGMDIMIQAVSGDQVQLIIYYGNNGNTAANTGILSLSNVSGFTSL